MVIHIRNILISKVLSLIKKKKQQHSWKQYTKPKFIRMLKHTSEYDLSKPTLKNNIFLITPQPVFLSKNFFVWIFLFINFIIIFFLFLYFLLFEFVFTYFKLQKRSRLIWKCCLFFFVCLKLKKNYFLNLCWLCWLLKKSTSFSFHNVRKQLCVSLQNKTKIMCSARTFIALVEHFETKKHFCRSAMSTVVKIFEKIKDQKKKVKQKIKIVPSKFHCVIIQSELLKKPFFFLFFFC